MTAGDLQGSMEPVPKRTALTGEEHLIVPRRATEMRWTILSTESPRLVYSVYIWNTEAG